jgi:hypothetical protein
MGNGGSLPDENGLGNLKIAGRHGNLHRWQVRPKVTSEAALNALDVVASVAKA